MKMRAYTGKRNSARYKYTKSQFYIDIAGLLMFRTINVSSYLSLMFCAIFSSPFLLSLFKGFLFFFKKRTFLFSTDCRKAFALVVRPPTEQSNLLFTFQITTEEPLKEDWLKMLCRHVANTICKADAVSTWESWWGAHIVHNKTGDLLSWECGITFGISRTFVDLLTECLFWRDDRVQNNLGEAREDARVSQYFSGK